MRKLLVITSILTLLFFAVVVHAQEPDQSPTCDSIASWAETVPLPFPITAYQNSHKGFIYLIGGYTTNGLTTTVLYAAAEENGQIPEWVPTTPIAIPVKSYIVEIISDTFYVTGQDVIDDHLVSQQAEINQDGSIGEWQETDHQIQDYSGYTPFANGYYYGYGGNNIIVRSVDKQIWEPVNEAPERGNLVSNGDYLYVLGNGYNSANVHYWDTRTPPTPSDYGVTINEGNLFTNQITNTLLVGQPAPWSWLVQVSNDGGFAGATWESYTPCKSWTITQYGVSILPRTVYVRFKDPTTGLLSATFQDDIILDVTPPTGEVTLAGGLAAQELVTLKLKASDDVSGVAAMQVAPGCNFTNATWELYAENMTLAAAPGSEVCARFKDYAGNVSVIYSTTTPNKVWLPVILAQPQ